jgi:uncharacterized protein
MSKLLILILVAVTAYVVWRAIRRANGARRADRPPAGRAERMIDCSQCGLHLPISEAVEAQGRYFCSDEHRRLFKQ